MKERVKVFTYASGEGSMVLESELEDHINDWLVQTRGQVVRVTQSESQRTEGIQHVTVCVWYLPEDEHEGAGGQ